MTPAGGTPRPRVKSARTCHARALASRASPLALMPPLVTLGFARRYSLVPLARDGGSLVVAVADPASASSRYAVNVLHFRTGLTIELLVADERQIDAALDGLGERGWDAPRGDDD